jgi:ribonuclease D
MVYAVLGRKLSKEECFSNWHRRPLRRAQVHYAAIDAYVCLVLDGRIQEYPQVGIS